MIETPMVRPFWEDKPELQDVTVLICQNKTPDLIRLSIESLLTFYPTIKILVVNGTTHDEAGLWLKYKERMMPTLSVWDRVGYDSHGVAMHEAICQKINTPFVLTLDSDIIVKRGGWIEEMLYLHTGFAVGALMRVSRSKYACGLTDDEADKMDYIHPSTALINREMYLEMVNDDKRHGFTDHGAPCVYTYLEVERRAWQCIGFPVADYVMHLSGASWTKPRTVWSWDNGVFIRPMVTFISSVFIDQNCKDYDIVPESNHINGNFVIHGQEPVEIDNNRFAGRLRITGDWVCPISMQPNLILLNRLRDDIIRNGARNIVTIDGVVFYERKFYQNSIAWV